MRPQRTIRGMPHLPSKDRRKVYSVRVGATRLRHVNLRLRCRQQIDLMNARKRGSIDPLDRGNYHQWQTHSPQESWREANVKSGIGISVRLLHFAGTEWRLR